MELGKPWAGKPPARFDEGSEAKAAAQPKCWPPRTLLAYSTRRFLARLDNPNRKPYREDVPTILRERGFRFFFYMADKFEPPHVHVQREDCAAKL